MKMMKVGIALILFFIGMFGSVAAMAEQSTKRVLMVLSGYGEEQGKKAPGYEFSEFAKAWLVFKENNVQVDIASPQGGEVVADNYDPQKSYNALVLDDAAIMAKLTNTLATSSIDARLYDGVFVVGGKGAMFDLPKDESLHKLIAEIYENEGGVAAVCHGPAALIDVKLSDGTYLVADKAVNGFTNTEEKLFGKKWLPHFEFMLEDKLIERGGRFQSSDIMLNHVAVDGRLITGQNPSSTTGVAVELVRTLGIQPKPVKLFRDDNTMAQVAKFLAGEKGALAVIPDDAEKFHIELAGMYGYYYLMLAETDAQLHNALALMQIAQKSINNPQLDMQIAETQRKLGDKAAAISTLNQILASHPDFTAAQALLESLTI